MLAEQSDMIGSDRHRGPDGSSLGQPFQTSESLDERGVIARIGWAVPQGTVVYGPEQGFASLDAAAGYYYGFANEGLLPVCRPVHVRPAFRSSNWQQYEEVDERFALALIEEAKTGNPVILRMDYHLSPVPKTVRDHLRMRRLSRFGKFPGLIRIAMPYVPGIRKFSNGSWAAAFSGATRVFTAATSSTPSTARRKQGSIGSFPPLRGIAQEFKVHRWAGRMQMDAAGMRQCIRIERQMNVRDARITTGGQA